MEHSRTCYLLMRFWLLIFSLTFVVLGGEFTNDIKSAQALLLTAGPTLQVLQEFNQLIHRIETVDNNDFELSQLYFKKSLIEINLGKEKEAIKGLHRALDLDPLLTPAKNKLMELLIEFSEFDDPVFSDVTDKEIITTIETFRALYSDMTKSMETKDYSRCTDTLDQLIKISPMNTLLYKNQVICARPQKDSRKIMNAMNKLIKLEPVENLDKYCDFSNYLLFFMLNFQKAYSNIKQCLRINNEFQECGRLSKIFTRYNKILDTLESYSVEIGHIYLKNEGDAPSIGEINLNDKFDFSFINTFLNEQPNKRLAKGLSVKTNFEYLMHLSNQFAKTFQTGDLKFTDDLKKLYCESYIQIGNFKGGSKVCRSIDDNDFLPKFIEEIDNLIAKNKFSEAEQILKSFPPNTAQSELFKSRWVKIERFNQQQQAKKQQEQQRFYQQQQQRQYAAPPKSKPKNDYYKILDIPKDADEKTIKKAYRTQTLKYHPDKYKGNDLTPQQIEAKMQDINLAHEVLSNPEMRQRYDRGDDPMDSSPPQQQHASGNGAPRFNFGNGHHQFTFNGNSFFGSQGGFQFGGFGNGQKVKFQKNFKQRRN